MNIAHSTFYYKNKAKNPEQMKTEADLRDRIEAMCLEFPRYSYRRVRRKWIRTTDSNHHFLRYPNLIKGMVISRLNQVWVADITYIRIRTGFVSWQLSWMLTPKRRCTYASMRFMRMW